MKKSEKKKIKVYNEHNLPTTRYSNFKELQGDLKIILDENLKKLKKSIVEFGIFVPTFAWENEGELYILDGHQRQKAFMSLETEGYIDDETGEVIKYKIPEVPYLTISAENKKDAGKKLLQLNSKYGSINDETTFFEEFEIDMSYIDDIEIPELEDINIDFDDEIDFGDEDLDDMEVDENAESVCQDGDLWKLGKHRLICGDCLDESIMRRLINNGNLNNNLFDMVFTDPPYNVNYEYNNYEDNKSDKEYLDFIEKMFNVVNNNIKDGGSIYIMSGDKYLLEIGTLFKNIFRFSQILFWVKDNPTLGNSDYQYNYEAILYGWKKGNTHQFFGGNVIPAAYTVDRERGKDKTIHKAQRPIKLVSSYIINSSKKNEAILDLFLGSGSTLMSAEITGRICYGVEIDKSYCDIILKRYLDYTGIEPVREDGKTYNELRD